MSNKTKVTIFGKEEPKKELKPIEFVKYLNQDGRVLDTDARPSLFDHVECISIGVNRDYSIFNAWNDDYFHKHTYLGHLNDGVV